MKELIPTNTMCAHIFVEHVSDDTIQTFALAVGPWMIGGGSEVFDVELLKVTLQNVGHKIGASVADDLGRTTELEEYILVEESGDCLRGRIKEGACNWPVGCIVDGCYDPPIALFSERHPSNKIDTPSLEWPHRSEGMEGCYRSITRLDELTGLAFAGHLFDIGAEGRPPHMRLG
jgi:hypothetical protein